MSDNNNNPPDEFENEAFDVEEEFEDVNLDEEAYDEADFSEDVDGDVEYSDEDFAEEEWQDDEANPMAADPNNKKLYRGGKEKKSFLSFNTIVIIGAVILGGGVLAFTVMSKTQEANQAQGSIFRSMLNISEIMDGGLFGGKEETPAPETTPVATTTPDATTETQPADGGFLNNPEQLQTAEPPQPAPIAPEETVTPNEPLTPMPEDAAQMPRTPDGAIAVDATTAPEAPAETPVVVEPDAVPADNKAEELLKEAMANRDGQEEPAPVAEAIPAADTVTEPPVPATPDVMAEPKQEAVPVVDEQTKESVKALEAKLDEVLNRMSSLESDITTLKQSGTGGSTADLKEIEQSVQDLKQDLNEIKSRPATVVEKVVRAEPADDSGEEPKPAPAKKKSTTAKKSSSGSSVAKSPSTASGKWELRAAQPGKAWVSKSGERDMRGVQVGETLPGIGQITGILYQNGRWTVQGTQGQILQ